MRVFLVIKKEKQIMVAYALAKAIPFIMFPLYSSWLSIGDYGIFDMGLTLVTLLAPFISVSLEEAVFRFVIDAEDPDKEKCIISSGLAVVIVNTFLSLSISILAVKLFELNLSPIWFLFLISVCFFNFLQGYVRGKKKLDQFSLNFLMVSMFSACASILLVYYMNMGLVGIILGHTVGYCVTDFIGCLRIGFVQGISLGSVSSVYIRELVKYSAPLIINSVSWWIMNASDRVVIRAFLGKESNGIYAVACKMAALCAAVFPLISASLQERFIKLQDDEKRESKYEDIFNMFIGTAFVAIMFVVYFSGIIFWGVVDQKYSGATRLSLVLICASVFQLISVFMGGIQVCLKKSSENGKSTLAGAVINILVDILLIRYIHLYAAVLSTLVSYLIVSVIRIIDIRKIYKINPNRQTLIITLVLIISFIIEYFSKSLLIDIIGSVIAFVWSCINLLKMKNSWASSK